MCSTALEARLVGVSERPYISVVTPIYNASGTLHELYRRICEELRKITESFEVIMINDCCPFGSGVIANEIAQYDQKVKVIHLSKNYGQHIAISAGLDYAQGDYVFVMDCDLQDPPDEMGPMLDKLRRAGAEVCFACRNNRKEGKKKLFFSAAFAYLIRKLTHKDFWCRHNVATFSVITRKVVMAFREVGEPNRSYAGILLWLGFRKVLHQIESRERYAGKSGYTFWKSVRHAISIILQQSVKPLYLSVFFALVISAFFVGYAVYAFIKWMFIGQALDGWTSIALLISGLFSAVFIVLSVLCVYVANLFVEVHRRPLYVVRDARNILWGGG